MTHTIWALVIVAAGLTSWTAAVFAGGLAWRLRASLRVHFARQARWPLRLRVVEREDFGPDLFRLVLARDGWWRRLPAFAAGQYLTVMLPDGAARRCYSLASWQRRPRRYELAIRREAGGLVSQWLYANAQPGCRIAVEPPRGTFVLKPEDVRDREVSLIAGGIGITPLRAMVHRLVTVRRMDQRQRLTLFYCVRHEQELMYRAEFEQLAGQVPWFRFVPLISRPATDWLGRRGRIDASVISAGIPRPEAAAFFLCASNKMLEHAISVLRGLGAPDSHIHHERFSADTENTDTRSYQIVINGTAAPAFQAQSSLLCFFEQHKLPIAADCRAGACGLCRLRLVEGEVAWTIPPETDPGPGQILACCTVPRGDLRLQLGGATGVPETRARTTGDANGRVAPVQDVQWHHTENRSDKS
ncbi:MAG: 2Fe-2S iron-sulfur cluster-binding protein [Sulfuricaulis sp.]|uniref:2Fe-2S iron-sulfur cluster-binding protein n=1 Tax=Sulfuricaulis sp. TaxID=2003553 RepID=UPI0034A5C6EA